VTAARTPPTKADLTKKKSCGKCHKRKILDDFHVSNGRPDGRQAWCRTCMNRIMRRIMRKKSADLRAFRLMKAMLDHAIAETQ
jgi:hypothetical protein